jgi:hypothetical protein
MQPCMTENQGTLVGGLSGLADESRDRLTHERSA